MKNLIVLFTLMFYLPAAVGAEAGFNLSVESIERAITWVKPSLESQKVVLYARAISKAAKRYRIDPLTLIAIAHQESSFRENLPVGKAGELGMLQIRRSWVQNPKFRKAFRNVKEQDLKNPVKAFTFAAWILNDLKRSKLSEKLPYWTLYNARKFENRLKYYLRVKRHLAAMETKKQRYSGVELAKSQVENLVGSEQWKPQLPPTIPMRIQPREFLNQINWHQKALEALKEQES